MTFAAEWTSLRDHDDQRRGIYRASRGARGTVILNDRKLPWCFACCQHEGWADVYLAPIHVVHNEIAHKRLYGRVELRP